MLTITDATDLWLGDLARRGRRPRTRDRYRRTLHKFSDQFPSRWDVAKITTEECERFLGQWSHRSRGTQVAHYQAVRGLFAWLYRTRRIKQNPMEFLEAPVRQRPGDIERVSVTTNQVRKLLREARTPSERNALYILAYLGPRRQAVSDLRLRDYNRETGHLRFFEKGSKTIWKPVPHPLKVVLDQSIREGHVREPDDYLVPMRSPQGQRRPGNRDPRIILNIVNAVASRVGVPVHVHALRAAFAVFYIEENPGDLYGLQELLGHEDPATTEVYLEQLNKTTAMERVRSLDWGEGTELVGVANAAAEKEGFEPSKDTFPLGDKASSELARESMEADLVAAALARFRGRVDA